MHKVKAKRSKARKAKVGASNAAHTAVLMWTDKSRKAESQREQCHRKTGSIGKGCWAATKMEVEDRDRYPS